MTTALLHIRDFVQYNLAFIRTRFAFRVCTRATAIAGEFDGGGRGGVREESGSGSRNKKIRSIRAIAIGVHPKPRLLTRVGCIRKNVAPLPLYICAPRARTRPENKPDLVGTCISFI